MIKVLIVDDQPAIRKLMREVLYDGFQLEFAGTAEEAIRFSADFMPDIILLDVGLPDMNGIDALPRLKSIVPEAKILILTGNSDGALLKRAFSLGASDYISKPFDLFALRTLLISMM